MTNIYCTHFNTNQINYSCRTIISIWFVTCNFVRTQSASSGSEWRREKKRSERINNLMGLDNNEYQSNGLSRRVKKENHKIWFIALLGRCDMSRKISLLILFQLFIDCCSTSSVDMIHSCIKTESMKIFHIVRCVAANKLKADPLLNSNLGEMWKQT